MSKSPTTASGIVGQQGTSGICATADEQTRRRGVGVRSNRSGQDCVVSGELVHKGIQGSVQVCGDYGSRSSVYYDNTALLFWYTFFWVAAVVQPK